MNSTRTIATLAIAASAALSASAKAQTTPVSITPEVTNQFAQVVPQLVRGSKVGPGMTVLIRGGAFMLPLMQQLAIAVERAGAATTLITTTDSLILASGLAPASQRLRGAAVMIPMLNAADLTFDFPFVDDFSVLGNRPQTAVQADARVDSTYRANRHTTERRGRQVFVAVPLPRDTNNAAISYADLATLRWSSMSADYSQIATIGAALQHQLTRAHQIRVTSPTGTDLTLAIVKNRVFVEAGAATPAESGRNGITAQLPGGIVFAVVEPTSASGAIRAPWDACDMPVENEVIDVDRGRPTNISASRDVECIRKVLSPLRLSAIAIGLNPVNRSATTGARVSGSDFNGEGMVVVEFGANTNAGGTETGPGQWVTPLPRATVYADGVPVVRDGRLVVAQREALRP